MTKHSELKGSKHSPISIFSSLRRGCNFNVTLIPKYLKAAIFTNYLLVSLQCTAFCSDDKTRTK